MRRPKILILSMHYSNAVVNTNAGLRTRARNDVFVFFNFDHPYTIKYTRGNRNSKFPIPRYFGLLVCRRQIDCDEPH